MSNRTYVCFDCRTTERVPTARIAKTCRKCRKPAHHVYYKFKVPARTDDRGWSALEPRVRAVNIDMQTRALARLRERRLRLERVLDSGALKNEAKRKQLRRQLRDVKAASEDWLQWSAA
jgi:hypothetical protein